MPREQIRIGTGSGFGNDYLEAAIDLAERGSLDYLIFDWIAERTVIDASRRKLAGGAGYDPDMETRVRALLPRCAATGTKIIANWGAADVEAAALRISSIACDLGLADLHIAYILGSDALQLVQEADPVCEETGARVSAFSDLLISAHAYQGAQPIVEALMKGADVVISGRAGDSAQYLAAMIYEFDWPRTDWDRIGKGLAIGHLMECGPQVTGGYFADAERNEVPDLYRVGLPIAESGATGDAIITKLPGSGGVVSERTCAAQLVYEILDPSHYVHNDGVVDFTRTILRQVGPDRVVISGTGGGPAPDKVKILLGVREGFAAVTLTVYAGAHAYKKAQLAADVVRRRMESVFECDPSALRVDYVGVNSVFPWDDIGPSTLKEVGLRIAGRFETRSEAAEFVAVVEALSSAGPTGVTHGRDLSVGGVEEIGGLRTTFLPQESVGFEVLFA